MGLKPDRPQKSILERWNIARIGPIQLQINVSPPCSGFSRSLLNFFSSASGRNDGKLSPGRTEAAAARGAKVLMLWEKSAFSLKKTRLTWKGESTQNTNKN